MQALCFLERRSCEYPWIKSTIAAKLVFLQPFLVEFFVCLDFDSEMYST
jgi:hypothetical protein